MTVQQHSLREANLLHCIQTHQITLTELKFENEVSVNWVLSNADVNNVLDLLNSVKAQRQLLRNIYWWG